MVKKSLHDAVAIVTGASSGIGRATALELARAGTHVTLASRNMTKLEELAGEIRALGRKAHVMPTDVTCQEQVERLITTTVAHWGRVDILIANAGSYVRRPVVELSVADVEQAMAVNFYGALYAVLAVLPQMITQRSGHVVLVTSMDAKKGLPRDAPYVASKFALAGFGDVLRQELHDSGVAVTTLFPGRVDTPMIDNLKVPWISSKISAEAVARAIVTAIERQQPEVIIPRLAYALVYLNTLSTRLGDWAVRRFHLEGWEVSPDP